MSQLGGWNPVARVPGDVARYLCKSAGLETAEAEKVLMALKSAGVVDANDIVDLDVPGRRHRNRQEVWGNCAGARFRQKSPPMGAWWALPKATGKPKAIKAGCGPWASRFRSRPRAASPGSNRRVPGAPPRLTAISDAMTAEGEALEQGDKATAASYSEAWFDDFVVR
eukprot:Skav213944  [mRNA]  locus=scaffold1979:54892:63260:- [translate_table: standard]